MCGGYTPYLAPRSNRFQTDLQGCDPFGLVAPTEPRAGPIQKRELMNRRLSLAVTPGSPGWPGRNPLIRSQRSL